MDFNYLFKLIRFLFSTTTADNALDKYLEASIRSRTAFDWVTVSLR